MPRHFAPVPRRTLLTGFAAAAASAVLAACGADTAATSTLPPVATSTPGATPPRPAASNTAAPPTAAATTAPAQATTAPTAAAAPVTATRPPMTTTAPAMMSSPARKVAIEYWHGNTEGLGGAAVREIVRQFNDTNPSITVTERVYPEPNALVQGLQAGLAARTPPAVGQVGYAYLRYVVGQFPHLSIEEAAKRDTTGRGSEWVAQNFTPAVLELGRADGVLHGMPYGISVPVLYYNVDILKQAGIERLAATWTEVHAQARQITERTGKPGIYVTESASFATQQSLIESNGGRVLIGSGRDVRCGVDGSEAIEAMQFAADMVLKDKIAATMPQPQGQTAFKGGQIGMAVFYSSFVENVRQGSMFQFGTKPLPTFGTKPRKAPVGGYALFIFASNPQQQAAGWEWIKHLNSAEAMTTYVKGSGFLPTRSRLTDDPMFLKPFFDADVLRKAATDQLPDVVPWVSFPGKNGLEGEKELTDARGKILTGQDVAATLRIAAGRVNQLIRD